MIRMNIRFIRSSSIYSGQIYDKCLQFGLYMKNGIYSSIMNEALNVACSVFFFPSFQYHLSHVPLILAGFMLDILVVTKTSLNFAQIVSFFGKIHH